MSQPSRYSPDLLDSPPGGNSPNHIVAWDDVEPIVEQDNSETYTDPRPGSVEYGLRDNEDVPDVRQVENIIADENTNPEIVNNESTNPAFQVATTVEVVTEIGSSINHNEDSSTSTNFTEETSLQEPQIRKLEPHDDEPPAKIRKISESTEDEQDGESCPICLDPWGNSGDHRLIALKCGHLFGSKCVERWLKAQPAKDRTCPTCKSKALLRDIRFIYARKLVAADTSEITSLQKQVETLQSEKVRVELELQKTRIAHRASMQQLETLRNSLATKLPEKIERRNWRFALEKNLEICRDGGCRVMSYNCRTYELYVSQKSSNTLFPGFGVRKVSCVDYKLNQFIYLHPKAIRDISYSQPMDLLLSVSLDSTARVVERGVANMTVQTKSPLWSCCWDLLRNNEFFAGGVGGVISQYDVRNTGTPLHRLQAPSDMSPVVSVCSTEYGLLSCSLNSSWLWVPNDSGTWEPRALPVEGPFVSLSYDSDSHRALVSCRPNGSERSRLYICELSGLVNGETVCKVLQTISGSAKSTLMSRATWAKAPGAVWIGAHSESDSALFLHGVDGSRTMSLPASEPALDVACVNLNGDVLLSALSESRLRIYKAVPSS